MSFKSTRLSSATAVRDVAPDLKKMNYFLQTTSERVRRICAVALILVAVPAGIFTVGVSFEMIANRSLQLDGKPMWQGALIVAAVGLMAAWLARRLLSRRLSANGVTHIPAWFIRAYGVLLYVGGSVAAISLRKPMVLAFLALGLPSVMAMLYIPGRRQR
jgi:hypothetical protein